jgi:hypothetical protein
MAEVEVTLQALANGETPAISVKTGKRCTHPVGMTLRTSPLAVFKPRYAAVLALESSRVTLRRVLVLLSYAVLIAAMVFLLLSPLVGIAGFVLYAAVLALGEWLWIGIREGTSTDSVVLTRVHPEFARAAATR